MAVRDQLAEAVAHHNAGRFAEAEAGYRRVLDKETRNFDALLLLGSSLNAQGRPGESEPFLQMAVAAKPKNPDAALLLAMVLGRQDKHAEAAAAFARALTLAPGAPDDIYLACARHQAETGETKEASETLGTLIRRSPDNAEAHFQYGRLAEKVGAPDIAEEAYRRVMALEPRSARGFAHLGRLLLGRGRLEEAAANLEIAEGFAPGDFMVHCHLGKAHQNRHDMGRALDAYAMALALDPAALPHILEEIMLQPSGQLWLRPEDLVRELKSRRARAVTS